jgi:hypothetical protein
VDLTLNESDVKEDEEDEEVGTTGDAALAAAMDLTADNWHEEMEKVQVYGSFSPVSNPAAGRTELQLGSSSCYSSCNAVCSYTKPQAEPARGFTCSFDIRVGFAARADAVYFFCGGRAVPQSESDAQGGVIVAFDVFDGFPGGAGRSGAGIYLVTGGGEVAESGSYSTAWDWESVSITYTPSAEGTWKVRIRTRYILYIMH